MIRQRLILVSKRLGRLRWLPVVLVLSAAPVVFYGAASTRQSETDLTSWLPDQGAARQSYTRFIDRFGVDSFVIVTWPDCRLDDPRLERFAQGLEDDAEGKLLIRRVDTGQRAIERLRSEPLRLKRTQAIERLTGALVGGDGQTSAAQVMLTPTGQKQQKRVVQTIRRVAFEHAGLSVDQLQLGGSAVETVAIQDECEHSLRAFLLPAFIVTTVMAWLCLRSVRWVIIVILVAMFCRFLSLAVVHFSGGDLNLVMTVLPVLVTVLTVSGSIHLVNYYRDAVAADGVRDAGRRALRAGFAPSLLAVGSTAIGLMSLCVSQIGPIRSFGFYSTLGLIASAVVMLWVVPAALDLFPHAGRRSGGDRPKRRRRRTRLAALTERCTLCLIDTVMRFRRPVMVGLLLLLAVCGYGLSQTQTALQIDCMFDSDSRILQDYAQIETQVGPLTPVELLFYFDTDCSLNMLGRVELMKQIERAIRRIPEVGAVMSAATFSPRIPRSGGLRGTMRRTAVNRKLEDGRGEFIEAGYISTHNEHEVWRMTCRAPALNGVDFGQLAQSIANQADAVLAKRKLQGVTYSQTGVLPMVHHAREQLLDDLLYSFLLAMLLICPIMMMLLRSMVAGLLAMIPNVFPVIVVFGLLGWLEIPIDISSVLTASIALGIAVDDTLHFLNWFIKGIDSRLSPAEATRSAYRHCALAMLQTTMICGFGVLVLMASHFVPTRNFAWLMVAMLLSALVGDLLLLPALLRGPLGSAIVRNRSARRKRELREASSNEAAGCLASY